ncbi:hypothetical protein COV12_02700 [Candidatus Woesearchaeota archaeon CG10_big_fil_rev_8_21_14_0_10_32_24]|nr:MAG: hypothetical protein COV12_02700 [Candidatus Woesearchaeota archaeon CG10_big_fil_rev_8_21_14_0_10_32_24]
MKFLEWHGKKVRKLSHYSFYSSMIGMFLIFFMFGSLFSGSWNPASYVLLLISAFVLISYVIHSFMSWHAKEDITYKNHLIGGIGLAILILYLGIQSPELLAKKYIMIIGFVLLLPATIELARKIK